MANLFQNWKEILTAIGGVLVIILQIINTLTSQDVENQLSKARDQLIRNSETLVKNRDQLLQNSGKLSDKLDAMRTTDETINGEIEAFGKQLTEHVDQSRKLMEAIKADGVMPVPTPISR